MTLLHAARTLGRARHQLAWWVDRWHVGTPVAKITQEVSGRLLAKQSTEVKQAGEVYEASLTDTRENQRAR